MADHRLRLPVLRRHPRPDLPDDGLRAGRVPPPRLRGGRGLLLERRPGEEGAGRTGELPGAEARRPLRRGGRPRDPPLRRDPRRGTEGLRGGPGGVRGAGRRPEAGRPRDADLHLGHDGRAERGDAPPEQLRLERPLLRAAPAAPAEHRGALVPAAVARPGADGGVPLLPLRGHDRLRRVDRQAARQPPGGEPPHLRRRPAGLREGVRPGPRQRLEDAGRATEGLLEGARRREAGPRAPGAEEGARRRPRAPALRLRPARLPEDPRRSRRSSRSSSGRRESRSTRATG